MELEENPKDRRKSNPGRLSRKSNEPLFNVEQILGRRTKDDGTVEYLVKWRSFEYQENSWEPLSSFKDIAPVEKYEESRRLAQLKADLPKFEKSIEWWNTGTKGADVMVFYPSKEDFKDFVGFMKKIEQMGAHVKSGICKIVPPEGWNPRSQGYSDIGDFPIFNPVKERIHGENGIYAKEMITIADQFTVREFEEMSNMVEYRRPEGITKIPDLEKYFWDSITEHEPIYGADSEGSIYNEDVNEFNMNRMGTILDEMVAHDGKIPGVNSAFMYFGMWKSCFAWHAEDVDLYSINYLHYGDPKFWYSIPPEHADNFEKLAHQLAYNSHMNDGNDDIVYDEEKYCEAFLRHKYTIITPDILRKHGIPFGTMVQYPGEFMITFPRGYHMGFNTGYNCAESTNFALDRWIDFAKNAILCRCYPTCVKISMKPYMEKYRSKELDYWTKNFLEYEKSDTHKERSLVKSLRSTNWLWARKPPNFESEKRFNEEQSIEYPHCAVCQYFSPKISEEKESPRKSSGFVLRKSSQRYFIDQLFVKEPKSDSITRSLVEDDLFKCSNCNVVIHAQCYPKENKRQMRSQYWRCERCREGDDSVIEATFCQLCEMRGGALIRSKNGVGHSFVHVICALMNRQTKFLDVKNRRLPQTVPAEKYIGAFKDHSYPKPPPKPYVSYSKAPEHFPESCYKCEVCGHQKEDLIQCDSCSEEPEDGSRFYHATCAKQANIKFETREWPVLSVAVCSKHRSEEPPKFNPGDKVFVLIKDGDAYVKHSALVKSNTTKDDPQIVTFLDGTTKSDVRWSEIKKCECVNFEDRADHHSHIIGSMVYVEIHGNKPRPVYYRGRINMKYSVTINGQKEPIKVERDMVFPRHGPLPEHARLLLLKRKSEN